MGCAGSCRKAGEPAWRVWAVEYGRTEDFGRSVLVRGAPRSEKAPISWMVWVARGRGRVVLVDTGIRHAAIARKARIRGFRTAQRALRDLSIDAADVTDVVLTHAHWDHVGNLRPWKRARFWIQRRELESAERRTAGGRSSGGVDPGDVRALLALAEAGRVEVVDGDAAVAQGVVLHAGGGHTAGSQWVEIRTGRRIGTIVLASDAAYLYENVERRVAIGSAHDPEANLAEQARMLRVASDARLIVPGHDPEVLRRFGRPGDRTVEIR